LTNHVLGSAVELPETAETQREDPNKTGAKVVEAAGVEPASERPVATGFYMLSRPSSFAAAI